MKHWVNPLIGITVSLLAGFLGSISTMPAITGWYRELVKPPWTPPNWLFGPAWTTLYILMGISAGLIANRWKTNARLVKKSMMVFGGQLILNTLWSIVFFGLKSPPAALGVIVFLWVGIAWLILLNMRIYKVAAYLLIPYLLWVSFASLLNLAVVTLN